MTNLIRSFTVIAAAMLVMLCASGAQAQATRTWVSGVGDDANPCSRTAPCKTFAGAISKTAAAGEINCLDPGGFGALTITKAIIISCEIGTAGVLVSGTNGFTVNAGPNDVVFLQGLDFEGIGTGLIGINFLAGSALHVKHCLVRGFQGGSAVGISFTPNAAGAELYVEDTYVSENGTGSTGGGIFIKPNGATASALAVLDNAHINNNVVGVKADGTGNAGVKVSIQDSTIAGSSFANVAAVTAVSGGGPSVILVDRSIASNSAGNSLSANGSGAVLNISRSIIAGNNAAFVAVNSGLVQSYGDNDFAGNVTGSPPSTIAHN